MDSCFLRRRFESMSYAFGMDFVEEKVSRYREINIIYSL